MEESTVRPNSDTSMRLFPLVPTYQEARPYRVTFPDWAIGSSFAPVYPLLGVIAPDWMVIQPLMITFERDEDGYCIASDDAFLVYGYGSTAPAALDDYVVSLIDYYELLWARAGDDPHTWALFQRLRSYVWPLLSGEFSYADQTA